MLAVDALSFTVWPGTVTGFLGPNGAGESTTMRMMVGLDLVLPILLELLFPSWGTYIAAYLPTAASQSFPTSLAAPTRWHPGPGWP
jgi:ABC-type Na+ transport system ATPase subunit NatA